MMSTQADADVFTDKRLNLVRRYTNASLSDALSHPPLPDSLVFLLPDDDPTFVEHELAVGTTIARRGEDVYFRHIRTAELPE
jgi:hypothetical protein